MFFSKEIESIQILRKSLNFIISLKKNNVLMVEEWRKSTKHWNQFERFSLNVFEWVFFLIPITSITRAKSDVIQCVESSCLIFNCSIFTSFLWRVLEKTWSSNNHLATRRKGQQVLYSVSKCFKSNHCYKNE